MPDKRDRQGWPPGFAVGRREEDAVLALSHLDLGSARKLHELVWDRSSASSALAAIRRGRTQAAARAAMIETGKVRALLRHLGIRIVTPAKPEYPKRLLQLSDPPACLFVRGRSLEELGDAVAIVGARTCSPYGRDAALTIAAELGSCGVTVVSGAANGIDGAAHEGALGAGGHTVAVLGSGHDLPHPKTNAGLIERVARQGTVVSEYPPGTEAQPRRFPARNRIIAALSDGVVVVEGAERSGSLQTADHAGEGLGRQVMAVPGPIDSPLSRAPHELIRTGAALVTGADDVLSALGLLELIPRGGPPPSGAEGEDEAAVTKVLSGRPASIDSIALSAGLSMSRTLVALSGLELRGLAEMVGGRYRLSRQEVEPKSRVEAGHASPRRTFG